MTRASLLRFGLSDPVHGQVPCAALMHEEHNERELPCCLVLYGGGGSRESLASLHPTFERAWALGELPPCILATPDVGPWSFYLEDRARGFAWESFITGQFVEHVRTLQRNAAGSASSARFGVIGMSMGGYGALKLAFARPELFGAVGAVSPMVEPEREANEVPLRNRFFYPPEVPQALLGVHRDPALHRADHPATRARAHASELIATRQAIYIDAAGQDAFNAHDGAESLHRVLWELDVPHEYHLRRDADHAGPDLAFRMCAALRWVVERLQPPAAERWSEHERAWQAWLSQPTQPAPSVPLPAESALFPRYLRAMVEPQRVAAEASDPSVSRRYGLL